MHSFKVREGVESKREILFSLQKVFPFYSLISQLQITTLCLKNERQVSALSVLLGIKHECYSLCNDRFRPILTPFEIKPKLKCVTIFPTSIFTLYFSSSSIDFEQWFLFYNVNMIICILLLHMFLHVVEGKEWEIKR